MTETLDSGENSHNEHPPSHSQGSLLVLLLGLYPAGCWEVEWS